MLFPAVVILLVAGQLSARPTDIISEKRPKFGVENEYRSVRTLPDWIKQPILPKRGITFEDYLHLLNLGKRAISLADFILHYPPTFVVDPDTKRQISLGEFILSNPPKFIFDPEVKRQNLIDWSSNIHPPTANIIDWG